MEPVTWVLGGIAIAAVSAGVAKGFSSRDIRESMKKKVSDVTCGERREACVNLNEMHFNNIETKIDNLAKGIENLHTTVKNNVH